MRVNEIETLRKECGVSTYELEQKGIHPSLPATIEKGQKGYSMDSLIKYLNAIDEDIFLSVGKKENPTANSKHLSGDIDRFHKIKTLKNRNYENNRIRKIH